MPARPAATPVRRAVGALLTTALALASVVLTIPDRASAWTSCPDAAHRGGGSTATENSLDALTSALTAGADYLEMDVQVTSDGTFVLMHDKTIGRTTNGHGRIVRKTWQQLSSVRLDDFGASRVVVNSFSPHVVSSFHARYPALRTALDVSQRITVKQAASYGGVMPDHRHVTLHWLARLRAAGVATYLWTVDKPTDWARYSGRVTLLLTDRAAAYGRWRSTHCA